MTTSSFNLITVLIFIHFKKNIAQLPSSLAIPNEDKLTEPPIGTSPFPVLVDMDIWGCEKFGWVNTRPLSWREWGRWWSSGRFLLKIFVVARCFERCWVQGLESKRWHSTGLEKFQTTNQSMVMKGLWHDLKILNQAMFPKQLATRHVPIVTGKPKNNMSSDQKNAKRRTRYQSSDQNPGYLLYRG